VYPGREVATTGVAVQDFSLPSGGGSAPRAENALVARLPGGHPLDRAALETLLPLDNESLGFHRLQWTPQELLTTARREPVGQRLQSSEQLLAGPCCPADLLGITKR
jgi:hypothetical protein